MKNRVYTIGGWLTLILVWFLITQFELISNHILPTPMSVVKAYPIMLTDPVYDLIGNTLFSIKINLFGYLLSIITALPIGFLIGLSPVGRKMFSQPIDSLRFIPITALGGIFIAISGLTIITKISFLAFGIWVYLVPVIVQRIDEIPQTQIQMMKTLGANKWQTFYHLQFKSVISRLSDDIRILVGISWTYIIVAELKNIQGGLGSLIFIGEKTSHPDIVYAVIFIIIAFGMGQDKLFKFIDKKLLKFKHV